MIIKPKSKRICAILMLLLLASCKKQSITSKQNNVPITLDSIVYLYSNDNYFKGNILVAKGDSILFESYTGLSNIKTKQQNNSKSVFEIASISKSFTATMVLKLVEEKKLNLNDTLGMFPTLKLDKKYHTITIKQLLNHTSGMIDHDEIEGFFSNIVKHQQSRDDLIRLINRSNLLFNPGTDFRYSNFGYNVLAFLIEDITQKSFDQNLEELIFSPLKIESAYRGFQQKPSELSLPYTHNIFQETTQAEYYDHSVDIGAGGIYSNSKDLLSWSTSFSKQIILSKKSIDTMFAVNEFGWGFGWEKRTIDKDADEPIKYISHGALANGYWGLLSKVDDYTIIILSNHRPNEIILNNVRPIPIRFINENIIKVLKNKKPLQYNKSLARKFSIQIKNNDFQDVRMKMDEASQEFIYNDGEFLVLGYELMEFGQNEKGIDVFNYMLEKTKDKGLALECLGDGYFYYLKDYEKAKSYYSKVLEYHPDNGYVKSQIKTIETKSINNKN